MSHSAMTFLGKLDFLSEAQKLEWYPLFRDMGVRVVALDAAWNHVRLLLPLNWQTKNHGGNMFGGAQASLADPIPALAIAKNFPNYRVMTKALSLDFIRVGDTDLTLCFDFDPKQKQTLAQELAEHGRADACFHMHYIRSDGKVCTRIRNTVAVRPKGYTSEKEHV